MSGSQGIRPWLVPVIVFTGALVVYAATAPRGLTWAHDSADGGDLIAAAVVAGVPHPTGYPTFTLLAALFAHLPLGALAWRVSLISVVSGATAAALVAATVQAVAGTSDPAFGTGEIGPSSRPVSTPGQDPAHLVGDPPGQPVSLDLLLVQASSIAAGFLLAFSPLLWSQATVVEVYALQAALAAALVWALARWRLSGRRRWLVFAGLIAGLALGNHLTILGLVPLVAALLLLPLPGEQLDRYRYRPLLAFGASLLLGMAVYLYLPWAAAGDPPVNWGDPRTWQGFWWLVSGQLYQGYVLAVGLEDALVRLRAGSATLLRDFWPWGVALALYGIGLVWRRQRWIVVGGGLSLFLITAWAVGYDASDSLWPLVQAWLLIALAAGLGLVGLTRRLAASFRWGRPVALAICLALLVIPLLAYWQDQDLRRDQEAELFLAATWQSVEPDALVVAAGDRATFSLWYARYGRYDRPDVIVVSRDLWPLASYRETVARAHPELAGDELPDTLADLLALSVRDRPVYLVRAPGPPAASSGTPDPPLVPGHDWVPAVAAGLSQTPGPGVLWRLREEQAEGGGS